MLLAFSACRPEPEGVELVDELVVKTKVAPDVDFSAYQTYTIPTDTIGYLTNVDPNDTIREYSPSFPYPRLVIDAVKENLDTEFTKTDIDNNPDLGVNVYVVNGLNIYQEVVTPYYDSYYYGYYGSYYGSYIATYVTNRATLIVEIVDLKNQDVNGGVKVLWTAFMGDVINSLDYEQQSVDAIHQAFDQSPYIFE
jgi:hypothetical protein